MFRLRIAGWIVFAIECAAFGQPAPAPLKFEVASIKPSPPPPDGNLMVRMGGGPGRIEYSNVSLKAMIQRACEVQAYQVSGPEWMASTRFNVVATLPGAASKSKVPEILRWLLAERFQVSLHRETRESPGFALVVGKNGPTMKEVPADPDPSRPDVSGGSGSAAGLDCGPPGGSVVQPGWYLSKPSEIEGHAVKMASLANMLGALLERPVMDQTWLKGNYDFKLSYIPEERPQASKAETNGMPEATDPNTSGASLISGVQTQLGLKLERTTRRVELIVVDHAEKTPTEN
jgi:uncharacterized protein (TIGR03435 family)